MRVYAETVPLLLSALVDPFVDDIQLASGKYVLPSEGLLITRPLTLCGTPGTVLYTVPGANAIEINSSYVNLDTLLIKPSGQGAPIGAVVFVPGPAVGIRLRRVRLGFAGPSANGFWIEGNDTGAGAVQHVTIEDCEAVGMGGHGLFIAKATATRIVGGSFGGGGGCGIHAERCVGLRVWGSSLESGQRGGVDPIYGAQLRLKLCHGFNLQGLHIEDFSRNGLAQNGIVVEACKGGMVGTSTIGNFEPRLSTGVRIVGSEAIQIGPQNVGGLATYVNVDSASRRIDIGPPAPTDGPLPQVVGTSFTRGVRKVGW